MNGYLRAGLLVALLAFGLLGGCGTDGETDSSPPGRLLQLEYNRVRGTIAGEDFFISVSPEKILWTSYWSEENGGVQAVEKENVPIIPDQWAEIERNVLALYPALSACVWQEPGRLEKWRDAWSDTQVMDGGDRDEFTLTWSVGEEKQTIRYRQPNDPGVLTLIGLLEEAAKTQAEEAILLN